MKCVEVYKELYHQEPFDVAFCPYRISQLGAYIDHQYGKINGLAIDKGGAARMLGEKQRLKVGLSGSIEGSLPIGGLSSSASVIICFLSALCKVNGIHLENSNHHA